MTVKAIRALDRGLDVLRIIQESKAASLNDLHLATRLAKATLLRILKTLISRDLIWQRMGREIPNDDDGAPCGCKPTLFSVVPSPVALHVLPAAVTAQIPMLQPYRYATVGKLLLIVNPDDRKIVDIISPWKIVDVVRP